MAARLGHIIVSTLSVLFIFAISALAPAEVSDAGGAQSPVLKMPTEPIVGINHARHAGRFNGTDKFDVLTTEAVTIPVLENALGDMNGDGGLDVLDALVLRDFVHQGGGTPEEVVEGDLNLDGILDSDDLDMLDEILLGRAAVLHVVGSEGGQVVGNNGRTTVTIPPNELPPGVAFCVEDLPEETFREVMGSDPNSWGEDSAFLAGAVLRAIAPGITDLELPSGIGLREYVPDGMEPDTSGINFVFAIQNDTDGDGSPELNPMGELEPYEDENGIGMELPPEESYGATLVGYERVLFNESTWEVSSSAEPAAEGCLLYITGANWRSLFSEDYEVWWIDEPETLVTKPIATIAPSDLELSLMTGLVVSVPALMPETVELKIWDRFSGDVSNPLEITLIPNMAIADETTLPRLLDQISTIDSLLQALNDDELYSSVYADVGADIQYFRDNLAAVQDSLQSLHDNGQIPPNEIAELVAALETDDQSFVRSSLENPAALNAVIRGRDCQNADGCIRACLELTWEKAKGKAKGKLCKVVCRFSGTWGWVCNEICGLLPLPETHWDFPERWCRARCCNLVRRLRNFLAPQADRYLGWGGGGGGGGGGDPGNFDSPMVCLHYCCDKGQGNSDNGATSNVGTEFFGRRNIHRGSRIVEAGADATLEVRIANSPIPVSKGLVRQDGIVLIPFNVMSGDLQFEAFDSRTGFFDDNVGSVYVASPEDKFTFRLRYEPDTSFVQQAILAGQIYLGGITDSIPRIECLLNLSEDDIGETVSVGFQSGDGDLTLIVASPSGENLINNVGETTCVGGSFQVTEEGTYKLVVTRGAQVGEFGRFVLGTSLDQRPAIPFLCGDIARDVITDEYGPVYVADTGQFPDETTTIVEAGVEVVFYPGADLRAIGELIGNADAGEPIRLRAGVGDLFEGGGFPLEWFSPSFRNSTVLGSEARSQ